MSVTRPAVTSTFTPPGSCLTTTALPATGDFFGLEAANCFPDGWNSNTNSFLSPYFNCPSAYVTAVITIVGPETRVTCCPSGFFSSTVTPSDAAHSDYLCLSSSAGGHTFVARSVQLRFQASDSFLPASTTASASRVTVTATITAASNKLSSGAKAGIAVTSVIAIFALLALGIIFWARRRRSHTHQGASTDPSPAEPKAVVYQDPIIDHQSPEPHYGVPINGQSPSSGFVQHEGARGSFIGSEAHHPYSPDSIHNVHKDSYIPVGGISNFNHTGSFVEVPGESQEDMRERLKRVKEERDRLSRIHELSQMEAQLEASIARS